MVLLFWMNSMLRGNESRYGEPGRDSRDGRDLYAYLLSQTVATIAGGPHWTLGYK